MPRFCLSRYAAVLLALALGSCAWGSSETTVNRFDTADIDSDETLTFAEYQSLIELRALDGDYSARKIIALDQPRMKYAMRSRFAMLDTNHDARLSRSELGVED